MKSITYGGLLGIFRFFVRCEGTEIKDTKHCYIAAKERYFAFLRPFAWAGGWSGARDCNLAIGVHPYMYVNANLHGLALMYIFSLES